jgi:hypothetical protein
MNIAKNTDLAASHAWPIKLSPEAVAKLGWPVIASAPKCFGVLHLDQPNREVEPVLAFVIAKDHALVMTRFGIVEDAWVECPELIVRRFSSASRADDREFPDIEAARASLSAASLRLISHGVPGKRDATTQRNIEP